MASTYLPPEPPFAFSGLYAVVYFCPLFSETATQPAEETKTMVLQGKGHA